MVVAIVIRAMFGTCQRKIPEISDRRGLSADVLELIKVKNAALRCASAHPTPEYTSRTRAFQYEIKARVSEVKNDLWSAFMEEIIPNHRPYWAVAKHLNPMSAMSSLKKPDNILHSKTGKRMSVSLIASNFNYNSITYLTILIRKSC
ncbi:hypothetical protein EVAR_55682_1 [Eumeta japonica]|uniref:Uncharacterized protein n=1 Tax=Eumeta variegata TaxID=151549 RepID=A0A4C1ZG87_EUMVA|nr:hypothetical protein EVAR_55682_1 [Eumeta japonica]